jgi:hypothetical protein
MDVVLLPVILLNVSVPNKHALMLHLEILVMKKLMKKLKFFLKNFNIEDNPE